HQAARGREEPSSVHRHPHASLPLGVGIASGESASRRVVSRQGLEPWTADQNGLLTNGQMTNNRSVTRHRWIFGSTTSQSVRRARSNPRERKASERQRLC